MSEELITWLQSSTLSLESQGQSGEDPSMYRGHLISGSGAKVAMSSLPDAIGIRAVANGRRGQAIPEWGTSVYQTLKGGEE